jgi:hypothetical protein
MNSEKKIKSKEQIQSEVIIGHLKLIIRCAEICIKRVEESKKT